MPNMRLPRPTVKASIMTNSERPMGYRFGSFVLDLKWGGLLTADGEEMPLRPKSLALLRLLVENAGCLLSREAIMTVLWPNLFVTENNVTQCIHDIRRALGSEASKTLHTLPRRGYRFTPDVIAMPRTNSVAQNTGIDEPAANYPAPAAIERYRESRASAHSELCCAME
jgi:DNA-binding winged helix-turn-helix (wHTH) protein